MTLTTELVTGPAGLTEPLRTLLLAAPQGVKALQRAANVQGSGVVTRNCIAKLAAMDQRELCAAFLAEQAIRMTGMRGFDNQGRQWFTDLFKSAFDNALPK
jgi:hypothetical protein